MKSHKNHKKTKKLSVSRSVRAGITALGFNNSLILSFLMLIKFIDVKLN